MDHGQNLGMAAFDGRANILRIDRLTPGSVHSNQLSADALHDIRHPVAEHAVDTHDDLVARLDEIDEARLHAGAAGAGDGDGQLVAGLEEVSQQPLRLVHRGEKIGIEVADTGGRDSLQHAGRNVAGARPHQHPARRIDIPETFCVKRHVNSLLNRDFQVTTAA